MLLALSVLLFSAQLLASLRPSAARDLVSLGIIDAAVYLFFAALLVGLHGPDVTPAGSESPASPPAPGALARAVGARRTHLATVPLSVLLGVAAQVPADSLRALVEQFSPSSELDRLEKAAMLQTESVVQAVMLVFVAACLVPLAEEMFFRGALYGALRRSRHSAVVTATVTSIGFAVSHLDPRLWLPIVFVAGLLGLLRVLTGSLLPCLGLHVGFNSVTVIGAVTGWVSSEGGAPVPMAGVALGWLLTAALLVTVAWLAKRSEHAARSRKDDADGR
jgi:membrane protease YdiL (CAAX protease family)